jgi:hypothetical protein
LVEATQPLSVWVYVTNVGTHPATFNAGYQELIDNQGREYSVSEASHGEDYVEIVNLNPGVKDRILLKFGAPPGIEPSLMVFRESSQSPGAAVVITLPHR